MRFLTAHNKKNLLIFFVGVVVGAALIIGFNFRAIFPYGTIFSRILKPETVVSRIGDPKATATSVSEMPPMPRLTNAIEICMDDQKKLCPEFLPEQPGGVGCLIDKIELVSDKCKAVLDVQIQMRTKCKNEIKKLCVNVPSGKGRVQKCLQENVKSLNQACIGVLKNLGNPNP